MTFLIVVVVVGLATFLIRASGILLIRDPESLHPRVRKGLALVGPAVLAALVGNSLFLDAEGWRAFGSWHIGVAVAVAIGIWRRNSGWALLAGAVAYLIAEAAGL